MGNRCNTQRYHNSNRIVRTKIIEIAQLNVKASEWMKKKIINQQHIAIRLCDLYLEMLQFNCCSFLVAWTFCAHHCTRIFDVCISMKMPENDSNLKLTLKPSGRSIDGCPIPMKYRYANVFVCVRAFMRAPECDFSQNWIESSFNCFSFCDIFVFSGWKVGLY